VPTYIFSGANDYLSDPKVKYCTELRSGRAVVSEFWHFLTEVITIHPAAFNGIFPMNCMFSITLSFFYWSEREPLRTFRIQMHFPSPSDHWRQLILFCCSTENPFDISWSSRYRIVTCIRLVNGDDSWHAVSMPYTIGSMLLQGKDKIQSHLWFITVCKIHLIRFQLKHFNFS